MLEFCPFDITRKDVFFFFCFFFFCAWRFILNETIFYLTDHILSETICLSVSVLMFHNNTMKISDKLNQRNLLKICLQVTYPTDFCIIYIRFHYGKK